MFFNKKISDNSIGMLLYLLAMLTTALLNIFGKKVIVLYHLPIWEVLFLRQILIIIFLLPLMIKMKFNFFDKTAFKPNVIRSIFFSFSTFLIYSGMSRVPLNSATAITFIFPILASILSVKILKEKTSKFIWFALIIAMLGTLIMKPPSFSSENIIGYTALFVFVFVRAIVVIMQKQMASKFDTMIMLFYTHIIMLLVPLFFFFQFKPVPIEALGYIVLLSFLFFIEYYLILKAYKFALAVKLQPLNFSRLLFVMILSPLIIGEETTIQQFIGAMVILFGFILVLFDHKKQNRNKKAYKLIRCYY